MERERLAELDLLRFIAASSVVLFHAAHWPARGTLFADVATFGFMGVPLFFTISGFVILMSAEDRSAIQFVNSRIARLYPSFWICVLLNCVVFALLGDGLPPLARIAANLTMQPRMLFDQPYLDPVYWTLAVEMKFYALVLLLIVIHQMRRVEVFLAVWLGVTLTVCVVAVPHWVEALTIPQWASLFCSGCYFYLIRSRGVTPARLVGLGIGVLLSMYWALHYESTYTGSTSRATQLTVLAIVLLINAAFLLVALRKWALPRARVWLWLGCLTYPLYLTHARAGHLVWGALPGGEWPRFWMALAVVLLASAVLAVFVERRLCGVFSRFLNHSAEQLLGKIGLRREPRGKYERRRS